MIVGIKSRDEEIKIEMFLKFLKKFKKRREFCCNLRRFVIQYNTYVLRKYAYRGVAQVVARLVRDQEVVSSSLVTSTIKND